MDAKERQKEEIRNLLFRNPDEEAFLRLLLDTGFLVSDDLPNVFAGQSIGNTLALFAGSPVISEEYRNIFADLKIIADEAYGVVEPYEEKAIDATEEFAKRRLEAKQSTSGPYNSPKI